MKVFAVSKVRLDKDGRVIAVLWGEVDPAANAWLTSEAVARVEDVVQAIRTGALVFALFPTTHGHLPDRRFTDVRYGEGHSTIALDGPPTFEREIHDMARL